MFQTWRRSFGVSRIGDNVVKTPETDDDRHGAKGPLQMRIGGDGENW
jgi:hypothetical protein